MIQIHRGVFVIGLTVLATCHIGRAADNDVGVEFFEKRIRPVLVEKCYSCHSMEAKKIKGGLLLDDRVGTLNGGDTGKAVIPGKPADSLLLKAIEYGGDFYDMPPQGKLPENIIADFRKWIEMGAPDPRVLTPATQRDTSKDWQTLFEERRQWWSLQPLADQVVPQVQNDSWCRTEVDRFIVRSLEAKQLQPNAEADLRTLVRRIRFTLTGLPPTPAEVAKIVADVRPDALEAYVDQLLASPSFGEHWARHWMDVVHYSDTHGYEWDIPIKEAWRYRDYLIRAFNEDVPYRQLVLEHLAGDLLNAPRLSAITGLNESLIGTAALFLGERRHGDSGMFSGITEEGMDNVIDTVGKAFLATTVACSRCNDHKLDAIPQRDYYAWAGIFMSSRWNARTINSHDPNVALYARLEALKQKMRPMLAALWLPAIDTAFTKPEVLSLDKTAAVKPESYAYLLSTLLQGEKDQKPIHEVWASLASKYKTLRTERVTVNKERLALAADFTQGVVPNGWQVEGLGALSGFVSQVDFAVGETGDTAVRRLLAPGLHTDRYSTRLQGAIRSPLVRGDRSHVTFGMAAGGATVLRPVIANAWNPEGLDYVESQTPIWKTSVARDHMKRRVYIELCTTGLNSNYPPRVGLLDAVSKKDPQVARHSWFGATRVFSIATAQHAPQDELLRFERLFSLAAPQSLAEALDRVKQWASESVRRFQNENADEEDALLIDALLQAGVLPNRLGISAELTSLVKEYRDLEKELTTDATVVALADHPEAADERLAIRGSYTDFGEAVPRGSLKMLQASSGPPAKLSPSESGRRELAESIANPENPLTARVYVNRVWHYLFGSGLVRTMDDFGHLGEQPSHPEMLDWLSARFVREGWSTKKLIRLLVTSAVWRQSSVSRPLAMGIDPENRLWHHLPLRRLEAESVRDAMLITSGRMNATLFGPAIDPFRTAEDSQKRLFCGPVDGQGRRSLYLKMTLMEPPKFLSLFNQPIPKVTVGRRDVTNVPDQALALLNDPLVIDLARHWGRQLSIDSSANAQERLTAMFQIALSRAPRQEESTRFLRLLNASAELRGVSLHKLMRSELVWQDAAHALFNVKEFIYVP